MLNVLQQERGLFNMILKTASIFVFLLIQTSNLLSGDSIYDVKTSDHDGNIAKNIENELTDVENQISMLPAELHLTVLHTWSLDGNIDITYDPEANIREIHMSADIEIESREELMGLLSANDFEIHEAYDFSRGALPLHVAAHRTVPLSD